MATLYELTQNRLIFSEKEHPDLTVFKNVSKQDEQDFLNQYQLPADVFYFDAIKLVAPRYEKIHSEILGNITLFIFINISPAEHFSNIEEQIETHVFILSENQLFWFIKDSFSKLDIEVIQRENAHFTNLEHIMIQTLLLTYRNLFAVLANQKKRIDDLNKQADHTTSNKLLSQVTETERNLVLLEHTINSQEGVCERLFQNEQFIQQLNNNALIQDVEKYGKQAKQLVHVYRDLFDAVSSLYSDIISNNLNQVMKFLSSISLIFATSSIIAEVWGMNTGGLPFEQHPFGTYIMILIAFIVGLIMYFYLRSKNFFDE